MKKQVDPGNGQNVRKLFKTSYSVKARQVKVAFTLSALWQPQNQITMLGSIGPLMPVIK